ncbi:hypothetical protein [Bacillus sp. REN16]|uniref:hypothetical protein n=1 Tax=Bacillus sp. REN16 TaxID=2887296 RepID=UPI001E3EEFFE|nr:hypothetical protein [Bacillus sp. REN16]MCC3359369.1 hypothetical protein [Bacillus sp. REN16]
MYVDYVNNLIRTIKNMSEDDYIFFEKTAYEYHIKYLKNERLRKADFKIQLEKFLSKETIKISFQNLNSYMYALEQMYDNGITDSLLYARKGKKSVTWRQLLLRATTDVALPKNLKPENLDEINTRTLKSIFQKLISACAHNDKDVTGKRLRTVDEFLNITFNRE